MTNMGDTEMLIQGSTSAIKAEIWCFPERHGITLDTSAFLEGPFSSRGKTLTTRFPFAPSKLREHDAWKATILEPVLWSPRMPALYELGGLSGIASTIGLRDVRIKGDSFYWEDRRWVARAAAIPQFDQLPQEGLPLNQGMTTILPPPPSALLAKADANGSPMIIDATQVKREHLAEQISRLSAHVSVTMILLPDDCDANHRDAAHSHVLLGALQKVPGQAADWARFIAVPETLLSTDWKPDRRLPVVATRECDIEDRSPAELRAKCDRFQADLDHGADYAGLWLLPKASL